MIKNIFIYIGLIIIAISFSDCTVQKRIHRDGYYVSWNKKAPSVSKNSNREMQIIEPIKKETIETIAVESNTNQFVSASLDNTLTNDLFVRKKSASISKQDSCGDKIFMRDGTYILGKVFEVGPKSIKYKLCDNLNGPLFVVGVDKIAMIQYGNGVKEIFAEPEATNALPDYANGSNEIKRNGITIDKKRLKYHKYAIPSFVLGFFFWLIIPGILSIIFGIIAFIKIEKHPDIYKGEILAGFWPALFLLALLIFLSGTVF